MSNHNHKHDETCDCGHDHNHKHDEACDCGHDHHHEHILSDVTTTGIVSVSCQVHDEAFVISGKVSVFADYTDVKPVISAQLEKLASEITARGGIVGHIKVAATVQTVDMFSVTDVAATEKTAPEQEIHLNLAAIVFMVNPEDAKKLTAAALEAITASAGM